MLVYCIKNKINDKEYIGLTKRPLESRWKQHVYESKIKMSLAKQGLYTRGKHPKAVKLLVDEKERFECIRDFSDTYGIPASTVNNKLRQGLVDFVLKGIKIQRIYE